MENINWNGFKKGVWQDEINVRDFIQQNYKEYTGDSSFLAPATDRTNAMMKKLNSLFALERQFGGVLDIDTNEMKFINAGHNPPFLMKKDAEFEMMKPKAKYPQKTTVAKALPTSN